MKKKRIIGIISFVLAIVFIPLGAFALKNAVEPISVSGGFVQRTVDRVDFTVDKTSFVFNKSPENKYNVSFVLTAKKTEADFYGEINSLTVNGLNAEYKIFTANGEYTTGYPVNNTILPATDGQAKELSWTIELPCVINEKGVTGGNLCIEYTSGVTKNTADTHLLEIPLTVTVK